MVRVTKHSISESNQCKIEDIDKIFDLYKQDLEFYIGLILTNQLPIKGLYSSKELPINKFNHSQWRISCVKQAAEIVKGNLKLVENRRYKKYKKLYFKCKKNNIHQLFTNKKWSELKLNHLNHVKIEIKNICINLDQRMFDLKLNEKYFSEFIRIRCPYEEQYTNKTGKLQYKIHTVNIPIKYYSYSKKYLKWDRKNTIQLLKKNNKYFINLIYEKEEPKKLDSRNSIGIDLGVKKLISDSNGKFYGTKLDKEYDILTKKLRGSKNYKQRVIHKNNVINNMVNDFFYNNNFNNIVCEDLYKLRNKSKLNHNILNKQQYFTYSQVIGKLERMCQERGIHLTKVSPEYTSQMCSHCGGIDESSRKGEIYSCKICGYTTDADTNAAVNILNRGVRKEFNPLPQETLNGD